MDVACAEPTTTVRPAGEVAGFLGGFTAAEGCFTRSGRRFAFAISLAAVDAGMCELAGQVLGVGRTYAYPRRKDHYRDECCFAVQATRELVEVVVPFMDEYLPPSNKRSQYIVWRQELLHYWEHDANRGRPCSEPGCDELRRARGYCRRHYFAHFPR